MKDKNPFVIGKVYLVFESNCTRRLYYDFGLQLGETITEGLLEKLKLAAINENKILTGREVSIH